jgi:H+-translocating NAD(P) transhydrogenase subunit alpha
VIVDLTAEAGGNCELTEPDRVVVKHGVTIYGPTNLPTTMPVHASQLYTHNVTALLREFVTDGVLMGADFLDRRNAENIKRYLLKRLERLGLQVTVHSSENAAALLA